MTALRAVYAASSQTVPPSLTCAPAELRSRGSFFGSAVGSDLRIGEKTGMSVAALVHDGEASAAVRPSGESDPVAAAAWLVVLAFRLRDEEALLIALRRLSEAVEATAAESPGPIARLSRHG